LESVFLKAKKFGVLSFRYVGEAKFMHFLTDCFRGIKAQDFSLATNSDSLPDALELVETRNS